MPDALPPPPVPADCDLRDFPYLPLDVVRLRDSGLAATASGDEFRAAVLLWCAAWHQVPAGSLPDDDRTIAHLAGYGRDARGWAKVKEGARRGWFKATDGRLYHLTVAEKAADAWVAKQAQRARTKAATEARHGRSCAHRDDQRNGDVTTSVTETVTLSKGREREGKGKGGGESAPPTPRPIDHLGKALRRRGIASSPQAITEWADFLQGACRLKHPTETDRALDLILEAAKRDGVVIGYSKHAAPFADLVARTLRAERKTANTTNGEGS